MRIGVVTDEEHSAELEAMLAETVASGHELIQIRPGSVDWQRLISDQLRVDRVVIDHVLGPRDEGRLAESLLSHTGTRGVFLGVNYTGIVDALFNSGALTNLYRPLTPQKMRKALKLEDVSTPA